ncbi:MAG: arylsulfatase [Pirellulaceae bacterium]
MRLIHAIFIVFAVVLGATDAVGAERPNVVFILTDDQGYGDLACHGNAVIQTPNLDRLHAESVRFTNFHVSPTCSQTRAQLMTGRYPTRTGVWHTIAGRSLLRRNELTLADDFRAAGYNTGIFGKWHLGDNFPFRPQDNGFQEVLVCGGGGVTNIPNYWANDYFDDTYLGNGKWEKQEGYCTDVWFRAALRFIESTPKGQPFFCYISTNAPHTPYLVPEEFRRLYQRPNITPTMAQFYGMITNIDENVGRLRKRLTEWGLADNTVLVFMTDNGSSGGWRAPQGKHSYNAGMRGGKGSEYDGGHRVPWFIHWPKGEVTGGRDVDRITAGIDVLPTLAELCDIDLDPNPDLPLDGKSLVPLLRNPLTERWPSRTLIVHNQRVIYPKKWRRTSIMTDRWRLVNEHELYDMKADPGQQQNVINEHAELAGRLRRTYEPWWAEMMATVAQDTRIVIGSDQANPTLLTTHDVRGEVAWNQDQVLAGKFSNGYWPIEVARDGVYEFSLRRWPEEVDASITAAIPVPRNLRHLMHYTSHSDYSKTHKTGMAIPATYARLKVAAFDEDRPIRQGDRQVVFRVPLKAGSTRLQAWFVDGSGNLGARTWGVYYVSVRKKVSGTVFSSQKGS